MSVIILKDELELKEKFLEMVKLIIDMRKKQEYFDLNFGSVAKKAKREAQSKVDLFLKSLLIKKSQPETALTVKIEG